MPSTYELPEKEPRHLAGKPSLGPSRALFIRNPGHSHPITPKIQKQNTHLNPTHPHQNACRPSQRIRQGTYNQPPTPNPNPKLTTPTGSPRPQSNNSPNPNPNSRQIPNRNPLRRHKLLRHPPNPRQIPTPTAPPLDRWRRIRRHSNRRAQVSKQPLQTRRPCLRRHPGRLRYTRASRRADPSPRAGGMEL